MNDLISFEDCSKQSILFASYQHPRTLVLSPQNVFTVQNRHLNTKHFNFLFWCNFATNSNSKISKTRMSFQNTNTSYVLENTKNNLNILLYECTVFIYFQILNFENSSVLNRL